MKEFSYCGLETKAFQNYQEREKYGTNVDSINFESSSGVQFDCLLLRVLYWLELFLIQYSWLILLEGVLELVIDYVK